MKKIRQIGKEDLKIPVAVAELKANLSKYLRLVRAGNEIIVTDHKTPVARIDAIRDVDFQLLEAIKMPKKIHSLAKMPAIGKTDSLTLLMEDRGNR